MRQDEGKEKGGRRLRKSSAGKREARIGRRESEEVS